jgi:hypothetical protein
MIMKKLFKKFVVHLRSLFCKPEAVNVVVTVDDTEEIKEVQPKKKPYKKRHTCKKKVTNPQNESAK